MVLISSLNPGGGGTFRLYSNSLFNLGICKYGYEHSHIHIYIYIYIHREVWKESGLYWEIIPTGVSGEYAIIFSGLVGNMGIQRNG